MDFPVARALYVDHVVTVATIGFCLGALLMGAAAIFLLLHLGTLREARVLRRVVPSPIGSWRGGRVAAEARTEYGTAGPQAGPVSGEDCVWYQVRLTREPSRRSSDDSYDLLLDVTAPAWPAIADATGRTAVDPRGLDEPLRTDPAVVETVRVAYRRAAPVPLPAIVPPDIVDGLKKHERLELTEVRMPRGVPVFALGRVTAKGLVPGFFTTRTRAEVLAARIADLGLGRITVLGFGAVGLLLAGGSAVVLRTLS
ncbi:hypothetical protein Acy02nite_04020 [Actinoplanes cyaneus]|uniref:RING-type E3 ubiquitin transferase n=1 Tax=Actinoplanes cyaneus TaxID=52696 RepID=A0A919IC27_9ACTN|nr:hypothetical protein [Actinoplanes cyaneus]MCW2136110.1 hypothetical protein [Actinoplanes cyaneus]GID62521.1 hypothetical protein Acy02nite_04020 [Actinoplanes cyaneus]